MKNQHESTAAEIHKEQQSLWESEHLKPFMFPFINSEEPAESVVFFRDWLDAKVGRLGQLRGLEMCCGKGRNAIWLARQGAKMSGFDFSITAIDEARRRALTVGVEQRTSFIVHDAVFAWP